MSQCQSTSWVLDRWHWVCNYVALTCGTKLYNLQTIPIHTPHTPHTHTHTHTQDGSCRSALYLLAANLPRASVNSIATGTLSTLAAMSYAIKSQDYSSLLVALTSWGQTSHVIKLTDEWLAADLQGDRSSLASGEQLKSKVSYNHMPCT